MYLGAPNFPPSEWAKQALGPLNWCIWRRAPADGAHPTQAKLGNMGQ